MSGLESFLASQASFVLAALAVSWLAVVLLALVVANLHFRLAHLEHAAQPGREESRTPFGHLLGRDLAEVLGPQVAPGTRLAAVLSSECTSCERILDELRQASVATPLALLWRDGTPSPPPPLPPSAIVLDAGPEISRTLGVRVTPFGLAADAAGRIVRAAPLGSVEALAEMLRDAGRAELSGSPSRASASPMLSHQPMKGISS